MQFFQIPPHHLGGVWGMLRPWILKGVEKSSGRLTEASVYDRAAQGLFQVWSAWDGPICCAVIVTSLEIYPSGSKGLNGVAMAGEGREDWQDVAIETLERFAKAEGCSVFDAWVRAGFEPLFKSKGYRRSHVLMEKVIG